MRLLEPRTQKQEETAKEAACDRQPAHQEGERDSDQQRAGTLPRSLTTIALTTDPDLTAPLTVRIVWAFTAPRRKAEARPSLPPSSARPPSGDHKPKRNPPQNGPQKLFYLKFFDPTKQPKPTPTTPKKQTPKKPYRIADASAFSIWRRGGGLVHPP